MAERQPLVNRAIAMATEAHAGQTRKYTGLPYITHPARVAFALEHFCKWEPPRFVIAAAWLHDVVEDTPVTLEQVQSECGKPVAELVASLTDTATHADGNRATRKAMTRDRLAKAVGLAQTIKCADILDNVTDIAVHDPKFGRVYVNECRSLLAVMRNAEVSIARRARDAVDRAGHLCSNPDLRACYTATDAKGD